MSKATAAPARRWGVVPIGLVSTLVLVGSCTLCVAILGRNAPPSRQTSADIGACKKRVAEVLAGTVLNRDLPWQQLGNDGELYRMAVERSCGPEAAATLD